VQSEGEKKENRMHPFTPLIGGFIRKSEKMNLDPYKTASIEMNGM
jgi:hypothetical protein